MITREGLTLSLVVFLSAAFCNPASARPLPGEGTDTATEIQQKVEGFRETDLLGVRLQDDSWMQGCWRGTHMDGFFIGLPHTPGEKVFYADVAEVEAIPAAEPRRPLSKILNIVLRSAILAGGIFGLSKVGGDTTPTKLLKVHIGFGLAYIALQPGDPPRLSCREFRGQTPIP